MKRLTATLLAAAAMLAACSPKDEAPTGPDIAAETASAAETAVAAPVQPEGFQLSYQLEAANYTVASEIDPAILAFDPALAYSLWTSNQTALRALGEQADGDKTAADAQSAANGQASWFMGYSLEISQAAAAQAGDVLSVRETVSTYTGGAHPNYFLGGAVYRKGDLEPVPAASLIADLEAFETQVVKALAAEKVARGIEEGEPASIEAGLRDMLAPTAEMPDMYTGRFALLPSTQPGKFGGLQVVFSPYDAGSYAEGAYELTLPASGLAPMLTPEWASRMGGEPLLPAGEPPAE